MESLADGKNKLCKFYENSKILYEKLFISFHIGFLGFHIKNNKISHKKYKIKLAKINKIRGD